MAVHFENFDAVLLDLDGTLLKHETPLAGAAELLEAVAQRQPKYAILSNSTSGPRRIGERLANVGMNVAPEHIYTAAAAACDHVEHTLSRAGGPPRVFNCATPDIYELLEGRAEFVEKPGTPCDAVIVGTPTSEYATPERQRTALALVRRGAALVGTCADRIFPSDRGIEFGAGALTHMLAYAAGVRPDFTGKPQASFFLELCRRLDARPERCVLIGDNLESDIMGGKAIGMTTVLMLTGVTRQSELDQLPEAMRPTAVANELMDLLR